MEIEQRSRAAHMITTAVGTFETCRRTMTCSFHRGRPEVVAACQKLMTHMLARSLQQTWRLNWSDRPIGFIKKNGEPYVEAHHVMPVSKKEVGSLSASNVMTVCANHHRQLHYGGIDVTITETAFEFVVAETLVTIPKLVIPVEVPAAQVHQAAI
jgi:hypothetical protein